MASRPLIFVVRIFAGLPGCPLQSGVVGGFRVSALRPSGNVLGIPRNTVTLVCYRLTSRVGSHSF
jgi:hypothetical protein